MIKKDKEIIGVIKFNSSGSAHIYNDDLTDKVYIDKKNTKNAFHLDTVLVRGIVGKKGSIDGEVINVEERFKDEFVGTIQVSQKHAFFIADNNKIHVDFYIPKSKLNNAKDGEIVVVKYLEWDKSKNPKGEVIKILGDATDNNTVIHSILEEYGLPYEFSRAVIAESEAIPTEITEEDIASRRDMRYVLTFTIDPDTAKDFDDALSVQWIDGLLQVGVHIADVSHYLKEGTELDKEAFNRGTSVYLVDRVVPMLPEALSNGLCSLRPLEEKLTYSAVFTLDKDANIVDEWFGRTVTYSDHRFTYEEAQAIIEGNDTDLEDKVKESWGEHKNLYHVIAKDLKDAVLSLDTYAKKLRKERTKEDSISFNKKEPYFELDENSKPISLKFKELKDSNQLIEDFMLLANRRVCALLNGKQHTMIQRCHDRPSIDKLMLLSDFVKQFGYTLDVNDTDNLAKNLNKLLVEVEGTLEESVVSNLVVRTMSKAYYSTKNIGHYGLGFEDYTHFTSPIRRYPDVMAHRLLTNYLDGGKAMNPSKVETQSTHLSGRERLSQKAQRASIKYKQAEFLSTRIGQMYRGVISSVTDYGIFVDMEENGCEGLFMYDNRNYSVNLNTYSVTNKSNGITYRLGDEIIVLIKSVDILRKEINLSLLNG
jgi:ribonuclease R